MKDYIMIGLLALLAFKMLIDEPAKPIEIPSTIELKIPSSISLYHTGHIRHS